MSKPKKPRNKKYSPLKSQRRMANVSLKHIAIVMLKSKLAEGLPPVQTYSVTTNKPVTCGMEMVKLINNNPFFWKVNIAVFCRDQLGREYMKDLWLPMLSPYYHRDLADWLDDRHAELIKGENPMHVINAGWIAMPSHDEITGDHLDKIYRDYGAYDFIAKHEMKGVA